MLDLSLTQAFLVGLIFVWSGFVRSGLGFGGAVLSLPFLLLVDNRPLVYLPLIAVHLLVFSSALGIQNWLRRHRQAPDQREASSVDWAYLRKALGIILIPKVIGVLGLLTLPATLMGTIIFVIVLVYAFSYVLNRPFKSRNPKLDMLFLMLGGYISGTSLIGAPLIIAVFATHVAAWQLRDTLFVLWFILVTIKMVAFVYTGVDLHLEAHLWLLPAAAVGHVIGLRFHDYLLKANPVVFYRVVGTVLLTVSVIGLSKIWADA